MNETSPGENVGRIEQKLLAICLWLMAAVYFFLFYAAAFIADNLAKYLVHSLKCALPGPTEFSFYVLTERPVLAGFPTILVVSVAGYMLLKLPPKLALRYFLYGFIAWLCGLIVLSMCFISFTLPFQIGIHYLDEDTNIFMLILLIPFVLPPVIVAIALTKRFIKDKKQV